MTLLARCPLEHHSAMARPVRVPVIAMVAVPLLVVLLLLVRAGEERDDAALAPSASADISTPIERIYAHAHLSVGCLPQLTALMNKYGFSHIVDLSGSTPDARLAAHLAQARASGGRITVYVTFPGHEMQAPGFGSRIAAMLATAREMGARGLKIPKGLGLGWIDDTGQLVAVDDPRLDPVFDAAGRLGMPVSIHTADPKAFWLPPDKNNERLAELAVHPGWSFYGQPVPSWNELLDQLERRIARHPNTVFVSVHFGNAAEEPERVARMLRSYPNLYIDTAARIPEFGRHPPSKMRDFFIEFQDRILYGTDLGVGVDPYDLMLGSSGADPVTQADVDRFFHQSYRYFETGDVELETPTPIQGAWKISGIRLPRTVLEKLYNRNARKIIPLDELPRDR